MKKKKKFSKNIVIFAVILLLLFSLLGFFILREKNQDKPIQETSSQKLEELGYKKEDITDLLKHKNGLEYALSHDYDYSIMELIRFPDYQDVKFSLYMNYKSEHGDYKWDKIVPLVNKGLNDVDPNVADLMRDTYYLGNRLDRYLAYQKKYTSKKISDIVADVNSNIDYDFYTHVQKSDVSKGFLMIANKYYQLENNYQDKNLITMGSSYSRVGGAQLNKETYNAFTKMSDAAKANGLTVVNVSAYRSYSSQNYIYNNYVSNNGQAWADSWSARPGYSEHQTGLALDVGTISSTFDNFEMTPEFEWLKDNAHNYGFILRYPKDKVYITGYNYEPWHYRYVGTEVAKMIYEKKLTFEEYYAYYVDKK